MALVRLQAVGSFTEQVQDEAQEVSTGKLDRDACLVYVGQFDSMDGPVTVTEEHLNRLVSNHNSHMGKLKRLVGGEPLLKDCPPIQLDHSTSAVHTIGRLIGDLRLGEAEFEGVKLPAVFGKVRVLGSENIEKVRDGRWTHLSIGADFESGKINELTVTPFPAAANATLLSRLAQTKEYRGCKITLDIAGDGMYSVTVSGGKVGHLFIGYVPGTQPIRGFNMAKEAIDELLEKYRFSKGDPEPAAANASLLSKNKVTPEPTTRLTEGEPMDKEKLKKHLMEHHKMSAEDADKKLAACDDEEMKKLSKESADHEEEEKKRLAAADEDAKKLKEAAQLTAKTEFKRLVGGFKAKASEAQVKLKAASLTDRLMRLRAGGKITPAEIKALNITELAAKGDVAVEAALSVIEKRQPVIEAGVYGSVNAINLAAIETKRKEAESFATRMSNMPFTKGALKASSKQKNGSVRLGEGEGQTIVHVDTTPHQHSDNYEAMCRMIDEGHHDEVKKHLKGMFDKMAGAPESNNQDAEAPVQSMSTQMSTLAEDVTHLQNQVQELVKLVRPALGFTEAEEE